MRKTGVPMMGTPVLCFAAGNLIESLIGRDFAKLFAHFLDIFALHKNISPLLGYGIISVKRTIAPFAFSTSTTILLRTNCAMAKIGTNSVARVSFEKAADTDIPMNIPESEQTRSGDISFSHSSHPNSSPLG
jgi:hypothetical protein